MQITREANWTSSLSKPDLLKPALKDILGQEHESVDETSVRAAFSRAITRDTASSPGLLSGIKAIVKGFSKTVLNTFFHKYYGAENFDDTKSVKTLIDGAFSKVAAGGLQEVLGSGDYQNSFKATQDALRPSYEGKDSRLEYFDWLDFTILKNNFTETKAVADSLKGEGFNHAFVMGMGGSSMNGKFIDSAFPGKGMTIDMMDNMDPGTLDRKLKAANAPGKKPLYVFISKSGNTFEVMHVLQGVIDYLRDNEFSGDTQKALEALVQRSVFVSEPEKHPHRKQDKETGEFKIGKVNKILNELKEKTRMEPRFIAHPPRVGGRFSLFSVVGMLISELKGLKSKDFLEGAKKAVDEFFSAEKLEDNAAAKYALLDTYLAKQKGYSARYLMPYGDDLRMLPELTAQLAGESNNKDHIPSLNQMWGRGPTAHHSDIEALCRSNPIAAMNGGKLLFEEIIFRDNDKDKVLGNSGLKTMEDLRYKSLHQAMLTNLALPFGRHIRDRKNSPVITTILDKKNEYNIGYLVMRYMLATAIQAGFASQLQSTVEQKQVEEFKTLKGLDKKELGLEKASLA